MKKIKICLQKIEFVSKYNFIIVLSTQSCMTLDTLVKTFEVGVSTDKTSP